MSLIKCKGCGRMISDRATVCPHCGHPVKDSLTGETIEKPVNETIDEPQLSQPVEQPSEVPTSQQPVYYEDEPKKASKALIAIVIILAVIAIGFGSYLFGTGRLGSNQSAIVADSTAEGDSVIEQEVAASEPQTVEATADTTVVDDTQTAEEQQEEETGFKTSGDIEDFVIGREWSHGDITLTITTEGIFANGNEISTSQPTFTRRSNNLGEITARPNISISVKYEERTLVDNHNGDSYEEGYVQ